MYVCLCKLITHWFYIHVAQKPSSLHILSILLCSLLEAGAFFLIFFQTNTHTQKETKKRCRPHQKTLTLLRRWKHRQDWRPILSIRLIKDISPSSSLSHTWASLRHCFVCACMWGDLSIGKFGGMIVRFSPSFPYFLRNIYPMILAASLWGEGGGRGVGAHGKGKGEREIRERD